MVAVTLTTKGFLFLTRCSLFSMHVHMDENLILRDYNPSNVGVDAMKAANSTLGTVTFHSSTVSLAHSLSLPTPLHSYWGRMGWGHQGRFETSQEIHHKSELWGGETSRTASGIILHVKKRVECVTTVSMKCVTG